MTREERIAELVGGWQEARDAGAWRDPEEIARAHPALAAVAAN